MNYTELKQLFIEKEKVVFKLFNLEYVIEKEDDFTVIYPIDEPYRIQKFKNFDELMKKYSIYNEPLKECINNMQLIS